MEQIEPRLLLTAYTLDSISLPPPYPNGENPQSHVAIDASGNIFGTTQYGGIGGEGVVYEIPFGTHALTTLVSFNGPNGAYPSAGLTLDSKGNLFGATIRGGAYNDGTIFEIPHDTLTLTTFAAFDGNAGIAPQGDLVFDPSGNLYGTTLLGGVNNVGMVFEIPSGTHTITTVANFSTTSGDYPYVGVTLDLLGNLFGLTSSGGANGRGAIFMIAHGSSTINPIINFTSTVSLQPYDALTADHSGNIFGAMYAGTTNLTCSVFEIAVGTTVLTTLTTFNIEGPYGSLTVDSIGNLFGTINDASYDSVVEIAHGTNAVSTLARFYPSGPNNLNGGLILDSSGNVFGAASGGGTGNIGAVFEIAHGTNSVTTLANFMSVSGNDVLGGVTLDANGNIFGTAYNGGASNDGTVFEIPNGQTTANTLVTLDGTNGLNSKASLTLDSSGNLFGTSSGLPLGPGGIFEIPNGASSVTNLGGVISKGLQTHVIFDSSGNLFGDNFNEVFEIARGTSNAVTVANFTGPSGRIPNGLVIDPSGNLFGTMSQAVADGGGTLFEIVHGSSSVTTLASFNTTTGTGPSSDLTLDSNGNLFGTAEYNGPGGRGTVFELAHGSNVITTVIAFDGTNGGAPCWRSGA